MSSYFGLFVTDGYGKIKSYNGNFYKLNKLEGFSPEGAYIDDYFHELSPHGEDLYSSFDIVQATMAKNASMLPASFRKNGEAIFDGHISSSVSSVNQYDQDSEINWFFGVEDENMFNFIDSSFSSPILQWSKAVSHEVNNPLQVLMGMSHMIKMVNRNDPEEMSKRLDDISSFIENSTQKISSSVNYMNIITRQDPREFELLQVGYIAKLFKARLKGGLRLSVKTNIDELYQVHASVRLIDTMFSLFIDYFTKIELKNKSVSCDIRSSDKKLTLSIHYNKKGAKLSELSNIYYSKEYIELPLCAIQELCRMISGNLYKGCFSKNKETIVIEVPLLTNLQH
jgi:hypothetical protein